MARTIKQIKKSMTDQFIADPTIRDSYGLLESDTFENSFSVVSLESILFGVVASAIYVLEMLFDTFRNEIDDKIATAVVASIPWYHKICLEYQQGDALTFDENTQQFKYEIIDESKQIIKFSSCRDFGNGVYILVAAEDADGMPVALSNSILTSFKAYMNERKPAGVIVDVNSYNPDDIQIVMTVQYDPLLINPDGSSTADNSVYPVENAVNRYLADIVYGGTFNRNKFIDAMQSTAGVVDVVLGEVRTRPSSSSTYAVSMNNNIPSVGGAFKAANLRTTISYDLQI